MNARKPGRGRIYGSITETIGDTPLVRLSRIRIGSDTAFATARELARTEGVPGGISSGAAIAAALEISARPGSEGKNIVVIIPSFAERYLSTALFEGLA